MLCCVRYYLKSTSQSSVLTAFLALVLPQAIRSPLGLFGEATVQESEVTGHGSLDITKGNARGE